MMLNDYGKSLLKPWCSVQNVIWALALVFLASLAIRIYKIESVEIAAWVQAIGSIAAIMGAFSISRNQQLLNERRIAQEEEQKILACCAVVKCTVDNIKSLGKLVGNVPIAELSFAVDQYLGLTIDASLGALKQIPAHEFRDHRLVVAHNGILGCSEKVARLIQKLALPLEDEAHFRQLLAWQCHLVSMHWIVFERRFGSKLSQA